MTLSERVANKKAEIEKRNKLLAKAETELAKAKAAIEQNIKTEWGLWYYEDEVRSNKSKLKALEKQLVNLQNMKEKEDSRKAVVRIEAIEQLLEKWKQSAKDHIVKVEADRKELRDKIKAYRKEKEKEGLFSWQIEADEVNEFLYNELKQFMQMHGAWLDIPDVEKFLDREVEARRENLVHQVEAKAGKIVDATALYFGVDDGINGIVIGDKKTVKVTTIMAGGYNIQCLHYRVLVK